MERGFAKIEEKADRYIFIDNVTGQAVAWIKKTGSRFNCDAEEAKMVQKIKRACSDYICELHHRKVK